MHLFPRLGRQRSQRKRLSLVPLGRDGAMEVEGQGVVDRVGNRARADGKDSEGSQQHPPEDKFGSLSPPKAPSHRLPYCIPARCRLSWMPSGTLTIPRMRWSPRISSAAAAIPSTALPNPTRYRFLFTGKARPFTISCGHPSPCSFTALFSIGAGRTVPTALRKRDSACSRRDMLPGQGGLAHTLLTRPQELRQIAPSSLQGKAFCSHCSLGK